MWKNYGTGIVIGIGKLFLLSNGGDGSQISKV